MGAGSRLNPFARDSQVAGPPQVRDHLGRVVGVGDMLLVSRPGGLVRVAQVTPLLHPGAPPNMMAVRLVGVIDLVVPRDSALEDVYRVAEAKELQGPASVGGDGQPPKEPVL